MTGLVAGKDDAAFGARSGKCPCGTGGKSDGRLRKSGGSERRRTGPGRYCGPGGVRGGGEVNCAACSNRENSGRFRLCGGVVVLDGTGRSFGKDFPISRGVMMRRIRKTAEGTVPGYFPAGPFGRVWVQDYSTVSRRGIPRPEAGSVTTMLRSSLVKWK